MKRKYIEDAAAAICVFENDIFNPELTPYYEKGFKDGAYWRINSAWHDASQRPNEGESVIIEYGEDRFSFHENGYDGPWEYNVKQFGFKRWAYVKDLMPEVEE